MIKYLSSKRLLAAAAVMACIYALIFFNAFPGDSLMYHLPFAARFWRLERWPDYQGYFEPRYQGFPILWRVLLGPGVIYHVPRLLFLPNIFSISILCWSARKYLQLHWSVTIVATLSFPVILYGFASSMQDFFVNSCAAAAAISIFSSQIYPARRSANNLLPGLILLALAANVKTQGLILASVILATASLFCLGQFGGMPMSISMPRSSLADRTFIASSSFLSRLLAVILVCLIYIQPFANVLRFGNPLYPVQFAFYKGMEASYVSNLPYLPKIPLLYNGLAFVASSTEIDPILRSKPGLAFLRTVHMQNKPATNDQPADPYGNRWILTGGSNGLLFIFLLATALYSTFSRHGLPSIGSDPRLSSLHCRLLISCLACALLPQSLELRYYMYIMIIPSLVAVSCHANRLRNTARSAAVAGLFYSLFVSLALPAYFMMRTSVWPQEVVSWDPASQIPSISACQETDKVYASERRSMSVGVNTVKQTVLCGFR